MTFYSATSSPGLFPQKMGAPPIFWGKSPGDEVVHAVDLIWLEYISVFMITRHSSLGKQPTFRDVTTGFPAKWRLRNERRNSILMTCHYPDLVTWVLLLMGWRKFPCTRRARLRQLRFLHTWGKTGRKHRILCEKKILKKLKGVLHRWMISHIYWSTQRKVLRKSPEKNNKAWINLSETILRILGDRWKKIYLFLTPSKTDGRVPRCTYNLQRDLLGSFPADVCPGITGQLGCGHRAKFRPSLGGRGWYKARCALTAKFNPSEIKSPQTP